MTGARGALRAAAGLALLLAAPTALAAGADLPDGPLDVPSNQRVTLQEAFWEEQPDGALWLRLRFVAPRIGTAPGDYGFDLVEWDMVHLCETLGLPWARAEGAELIVVSFAAQAVPFGAPTPEVAQFFEAYRPDGDECLWQEY